MSGSAGTPGDYTAGSINGLSGDITFAANEVDKTITLNITDDQVCESTVRAIVYLLSSFIPRSWCPIITQRNKVK